MVMREVNMPQMTLFEAPKARRRAARKHAGAATISTEIPRVQPAPAADEIDDAYLTAILEWGQSQGYEPRIAAPRRAGELLRIVMDKPQEAQ
jgi:hypothetical protein